jgi:hypothetical protein
MTGVPFPISRAYNSAPPTGTRLSLGVALCSLFSPDVEPEGSHAAYAHARIARTSVAFMGLKPITPSYLTANLSLNRDYARITGNPYIIL